jgi:hypothetical protein
VLTATAANGEGDPPTGAGLRVLRLGLAPGETPRLLLKAWRGLRFFGLALAWGCWHGRRGQRLLIASNPPFIGLLGPLLQLRGLARRNTDRAVGERGGRLKFGFALDYAIRWLLRKIGKQGFKGVIDSIWRR